MFVLILMIAAVICLALSAFGIATPSRVNLLALGLCSWALAVVVPLASAR